MLKFIFICIKMDLMEKMNYKDWRVWNEAILSLGLTVLLTLALLFPIQKLKKIKELNWPKM